MRATPTWAAMAVVMVLFGPASPAAAQKPPAPPGPHEAGPTTPRLETRAEDRVAAPAKRITFGPYLSRQVNVDEAGDDLLADAANEPSIAVHPFDPDTIAIGWRQFDSVESDFRISGLGTTADGGATWTTGALTPELFRSDPVLAYDDAGTLFYSTLHVYSPETEDHCGPCAYRVDVFRSADDGWSWDDGTPALGGDKQWLSIDRSGGPGNGHLYSIWNPFLANPEGGGAFNRSVDGGDSYETPIQLDGGYLMMATTAVGPSGIVYAAGIDYDPWMPAVSRSTTLREPGMPAAFDGPPVHFDLGGTPLWGFYGPNPAGFLGQVEVATAPRPGPAGDHVYVLAGTIPEGAEKPDLFFARSLDGGDSWEPPRRINDDEGDNWQWLGTLGVAPNGRIDVVWADSRNAPDDVDSAVFYSYSFDGGETFSPNEQLTPSFDPHQGWPIQQKMGDYYDVESRDEEVHIAYAATFGGEQNVYYLRLPAPVPPLPEVDPIVDPSFPDHRFWAVITAPDGEQLPVQRDAECIAETLCLSGAVPGRSEAFVRLVGPKPNGYLWPTMVKFSTSKIELWVEQASTGVVRYYVLGPAAKGYDVLEGQFDREGFLPPAAAAAASSASVGPGASPVPGMARRGPGDRSAVGTRASESPPEPPAGEWMTSPDFADFRAKLRITSPAGDTIAARQESECISETICASGAVAGRSELFVRVVGPKPNGYLWPTLVKFTTSQVEVWIEQISTGALRYYVLEGASPGSSDLGGMFDRLGFAP